MLIAFLAAVAASVPQATAIDRTSWFSADDYPAEAVKNGTEGDVAFEVDVDPQGMPVACRITASSGSALLDRTTCDILLKRGRFKPAMAHGKPVAGHYAETARWRLEGMPGATAIDPASWFSADDYPMEAAKEGVEGTATFEVDVDPEGKPTACRITRSSGSPALDKRTCEVVLKKGRFLPATSGGKAVAGRYSRTASWRLEGVAATNGYLAAVIDYGKDPAHPTCSILSEGVEEGSLCEEALKEYGTMGSAQKFAKLVSLMSISNGDEPAYKGDPAWGRRLAFVAVDLFTPKTGSKVACAVVATEGAELESDPCAQYADAGALSEADRKSSTKVHIEQSLFGIPERSPARAQCKRGESNAEVHGCR